MRFKVVLIGMVLSAAPFAFSQIAPSATSSGIPLTVGFGYSNYYTDWSAYESGLTLWVDVSLTNVVPSRMHGLGIELEARDLNFDRTGDVPALKEYTGAGGPVYYWRHYRNVEPYGKFLLGIAGINFNNKPGDNYTHDTRTVYEGGGGAQYRVFRNVWVRGEYDYQFWPDFIHHHTFNPRGLSVGVNYDLSRIHSH